MLAAVVVPSVAVPVVVGFFGLFGLSAYDDGAERTVTASVANAVSCEQRGATETVAFTLDGRELRARFDGCGHREGEQVEVTVPGNAAEVDDLVVHAAQATVGASGAQRPVAVLLLALAGLAGAGYAFLVRRGPRGRPLFKPVPKVAAA